jgi:prevent-host-death family protein
MTAGTLRTDLRARGGTNRHGDLFSAGDAAEVVCVRRVHRQPPATARPGIERATPCYVEEMTHRQMRNESADVLRRVAAGETILVTNNGQPAAVISPPPDDALSLLSASGQLREALDPPSRLQTIKRTRATKTTAEILADVTGRW